MHVTKQSLDTARLWANQHKWSLAILIGLFLISSWAVKHFKRPGQMSVIESQAMDMTAMKPPTGSVPVATEFVHRGPFSAKVRYTGSVAPFTEQTIYPRVEGWLTGLNVYNGDTVRAGQVLAVLNAPDVQNKLAEATYGHVAALQGVPIAQADLARMKAERSAARGEIGAAGRDVQAAQARVTAAQRMLSQAQKELKSAQASLRYWNAEIRRETNLLKNGAVSQQEFDSEQAQATAAEAEVENKQAKVEEAQANIEAAKAELGNKQSMVQIARDRASAADAALSAASGMVSQKAAEANMAGAARNTAAAFSQYRIIKAPFAGVVTKRYVNAGVLVSQGTAILNVAQIDRVRLQANVAEQDLSQITVGAEITARTQKDGRTINAVVSSISPLADQTSRTATVEAVVPNTDHSLIPGDFVSMQIATEQSVDAISIPSSAVIQKDGRDAVWITRCLVSKGKPVYYCTMHPEVVSDKPGLCPKCNMKLEKKQADTGKVAHLVYVTAGRTDGERTEVISGLNEGDEVIYAGHRYLREGNAVTPTKWGTDGPADLPAPGGGSQNMENMPGMDMSGGKSQSDMPGMDMSGGKSDNSMPEMDMGSKPAAPKPQPAKPATAKKAGPTLYTCPMHPEFITSDPKALCPKCNMKVEKMLNDAQKKR